MQLSLYNDLPEFLQRLLGYRGDSITSKFKAQIRAYNLIFAYTSVEGRVDNSVNNGGSPYIFCLNGQNHYLIGSLLPVDGTPKFYEFYIYNIENEVNNRIHASRKSNNNDLDSPIVNGLKNMLDEKNELAKMFGMVRV